MADDKGEKNRLNCPKCGSAAWSATKTNIPISLSRKVYVKAKCLNCGAEFDLVDSQ